MKRNLLTVAGLTESQAGRLRRALKDVNLSDPVEVSVTTEIKTEQYSSLWYGGEIATINYKGWKFSLEAVGDVNACLVEKADKESQEDREVFRVKDRHNAGEFGQALQRYMKTDKALVSALSDTHSKYRVDLHEGNWFECFPTDPKGRFLDLFWALDSDHAVEAIADVIQGMDDIINAHGEDDEDDMEEE